MGLSDRAFSLHRAIESVRIGNTRTATVIVVVNGQKYDENLFESLRKRDDIKLIKIPVASFGEALLSGRRAVTTPFFGFLDDDDEYLPGAVDGRLKVLENDPMADVVATNGYRNSNNKDSIAFNQLKDVTDDPLLALYRENWLASCGGFFRTNTVSVDFFQQLPRHIHWSWLAFQLLQAGRRVAVLDQPTFRINDTDGSASKSDTYLLCHIEVYSRMLASATRPIIRKILKRRLMHAWHEAADYYRRQGILKLAWTAHLRSLQYPPGWKFITYTRKLLWVRHQ
jgi:glycosyltransferase involved in cell wall biosynthesis